MRIIHLSDSHISCDKPARACELGACIKYINELQPQPDAVVHTGDITHNGMVEEYSTARQLLDKLIAPYFVLAGNRDDRRNLIKVFADGRHIHSDIEFVQYAVEDFAARLIIIDTMNTNSNKGRICPVRMNHIKSMLATDTSRPAVLFLHHPPFEVSVGPEPRHFEEWADAEALVAELQLHSHVRGIYCGHVHRSYETAIGLVSASVVSSVISDLRWDKPSSPYGKIPVFNSCSVS